VKAKDKIFVRYMNESDIIKRNSEIAAQISDEYRDKFPIFLSILNGSVIWTSDLIRSLDFVELELECCKLSSYQKDESSGKVS